MNLALGIVLLWMGAACLWVAFHETQAKTPWDAFKEVTDAVKSA